MFDVLSSAYGGACRLSEIDDASGYCQSDEESDEEHLAAYG